jgi:hypothetical protein
MELYDHGESWGVFLVTRLRSCGRQKFGVGFPTVSMINTSVYDQAVQMLNTLPLDSVQQSVDSTQYRIRWL